MTKTLFEYPKQSEFNRIVAKEKIYQYAKPNTAIKNRFKEQVERIKWQYKLSPETTNLPAREGIKEIQVFSITLRDTLVAPQLHESILRTIDKAINFPIIFQLNYKDQIKTSIAYKRPSEHDKQHWVTDSYFESSWQAKGNERIKLPVAVNLARLYEQILRSHLSVEAREDETLKDQIERVNKIRAKETELGKLQSRMNREKQFNRKVELNRIFNELQTEIEVIKA